MLSLMNRETSLTALAAVLAFAATASYTPPQASAPALQLAASPFALIKDTSSASLPPLEIERTFEIERGETLDKALTRIGVPSEDVKAFLSDLKTMPKLEAGKELTLTYTEKPEAPQRLSTAAMTVRTAPDELLHLSLKEDGTAIAKTEHRALTNHRSVAVGTINHSLYMDATAAGLPARLIKPFVDLFAWDMDFTRDVHPGDTFKVMFEETQDFEGERVKSGKILAAEFYVKGGKRTAYLFDGEYYDEKGEGKKKLLLKTPLETYRISSGFNLQRKHPVLGYTRAHRGTDFAAPTGTPVKASGDGIVQRADRFGSFGNYIKIKHTGTYSTAYAHLHRFARGIRPGSRVKQGQIIAYVGSTGRSTGPHLHYEVHVKGKQVDAMRTKLPTSTLLAGRQKTQFRNLVAEAQTKWNKAFAAIQLASR
ncbi:MAG: peptidase M23 [Alphaproteobacteria bacterium CG_4_10_14_0_8_um_filter_53_9]|nr:MAG: peptidase M23 [Alphaproteobacteria bacterium CG_4_10_14_0_8_um_filter_53_9]